MTICGEKKVGYCLSACCYIARKEVSEEEIERVGLENVVRRGDRYLLKSEPRSGRCLLLDEEKGECTIYEDRPSVCRLYSCQNHNIELLIQEVTFMKKKKKTLDQNGLPILD